MSNTLLYPAVGGTPGSTISREPAQAPDRIRDGQATPGSQTKSVENFSQILGNELSKPVSEPLKFSAHATARAQSRKLDLSPDAMRRLNEAVDRAAAKGLDDTLVLTKDAAFIVSVKNRTVVTAMDRANLEGNVFTNIDGAVIA
ncbi:MAG: TIGR02530 family flagellar biosynthesis protein [Bdellovibrionota bacterium]